MKVHSMLECPRTGCPHSIDCVCLKFEEQLKVINVDTSRHDLVVQNLSNRDWKLPGSTSMSDARFFTTLEAFWILLWNFHSSDVCSTKIPLSFIPGTIVSVIFGKQTSRPFFSFVKTRWEDVNIEAINILYPSPDPRQSFSFSKSKQEEMCMKYEILNLVEKTLPGIPLECLSHL